ncbi:hypothetical protein EON64_06895 [archaeon]|nr:MAG: hypothetical protein EON64_06895 [archaeon]
MHSHTTYTLTRSIPYTSSLQTKGTSKEVATQVGNMVGGVSRDTGGPAQNTLMKFMCYTAAVLAPIFKYHKAHWWVALVIWAILAFLYPVYSSRCPDGLKVVEEAEGAAENATGQYAKVTQHEQNTA